MTLHRFPRAALRPEPHVRKELRSELRLDPLYAAPGAETDLLHGRYFTVSPVGTIEQVDVSPPATFLAGDGMVFRLTLDHGCVTARSELVVDPTFVAQELLEKDADSGAGEFADVPPYEAYGVAIISLGLDASHRVQGLGSRLLANTALHPIEVDGRPMLLVTTDGGRPVVFDPEAMQAVGALGSVGEWRGALLRDTEFPFVNTTAHPAYDTRGKELYSIDFARDLVGELLHPLHPTRFESLDEVRAAGALPPAVSYVPEVLFAALPDTFLDTFGGLAKRDETADVLHDSLRDTYHLGIPTTELFAALGLGVPLDRKDQPLHILALPGDLVRALRRRTSDGRQTVGERLIAIARSMYRDAWHKFTDLLVWTRQGDAPIRRSVVDTRGKPVLIEDSVHQMAVTDRYVIFADTQFKFALTLVLSNVLEHVPQGVARTLRRYLSRPQSSACRLYFVERKDLRRVRRGGGATNVVAQRVVLPAEVVHFFADYRDGGGHEVVLTVVHQRAMDGAEFVATSDLDADDREVSPTIVGMFPMSLDLNDVTRYVVDPSAADPIRSSSTIVSEHHTWAVGIAAGPGIGTWGAGQTPPDEIRWTAWYNEGFLPELVTRHTYRLYRGYRERNQSDRGGARVSLEDLRNEIRSGGRPGSLFVAAPTPTGMTIPTAIQLPPGTQIVSPQWLPAARSADHPGFIVCVVFREEPVAARDEKAREVWIFRADELREPILRYDATPLGWQYTLHTAWIATPPEIRPPGPPDLSRVAFRRDRQRRTRRPAGDAIERLIERVYAELPTRGVASTSPEASPETRAETASRSHKKKTKKPESAPSARQKAPRKNTPRRG